MQYYYLDGLDKKGPYTKEELKGRNVTSEILVFSEGMDSWKQIKDIPELNAYLFDPEPSNGYNDETKISVNTTQPQDLEKEKALSKSEQQKIKIPSIIFLFLSFALCVGLAYFIISAQKQNDLNELNKKIDAIFKGKSAITDYKYEGIDGQLYNVIFEPASKPFDLLDYYSALSFPKDYGIVDVIKTKNHILAFKPSITTETTDGQYQSLLKRWNMFKEFVQYYESNEFSGFDILRIEKNSNTFNITKSWSGDMAYKVPESRHVAGYSNEYYSAPGYDLPTYRPSVSKCYEEAAKFLTSDKEDKSYEADSYNQILSFTNIETKFYEIYQSYPKYTRLLNKIHVDMGNKSESDLIDNSKITDATNANDDAVYNSQWIVWYKSLTNTYSVQEKGGVFNKYWLTYSVIGIALASLIFFLLKYRHRISIN